MGLPMLKAEELVMASGRQTSLRQGIDMAMTSVSQDINLSSQSIGATQNNGPDVGIS